MSAVHPSLCIWIYQQVYSTISQWYHSYDTITIRRYSTWNDLIIADILNGIHSVLLPGGAYSGMRRATQRARIRC